MIASLFSFTSFSVLRNLTQSAMFHSLRNQLICCRAGGYPSVRYGRRIPNTGPTGAVLIGAYAVAMVYGFYKVAQNNAWRQSLREEKLHARRTLVPVLQAEEDRMYLRNAAARQEEERYLMRHRHDWEVGQSVYNTNATWVPPARTLVPGPLNSR